VVCLAASVALSKLQQREYTASASILFRDSGADQELFGYSAFSPSTNDQPSQAATNMALVSLPVVASRTATALHTSRSAVSSAISVSGVGQANLAQVSATEPDPALAARIANTYAQQYVVSRQAADRQRISDAQALVQQQLQALPPAMRYGAVGRGLQARANQLMELAALQTGNAEVAQTADVPRSPSAPSTKRNAIIGIFVGLLLGLGLAFLAERFDRRIRDSSELEDAYGVAVLGAFPFSPPVAAAGIGAAHGGASAEAFGILRARLRYFNANQDVRSLLITSALPNEGKTTIAVNLANAEAAAGRTKTVLVDADLRRPQLAQRFGLAPGPGLTELLTRKADLDAALRRVHVSGAGPNNRTSAGSHNGKRAGTQNGTTPGFSVITAGELPSNPVELLESRAMITLIKALSRQFDLVIVDTPPTSVVPDAIPLMRLVTGVVIVANKNVITRDAAHELSGQLNGLGAPTLGVIVNEMPPGSPGHADYAIRAQPPEPAPALIGGEPLRRSAVGPRATSHRGR
jgi:succinoglycan biosynthesis transport protein ExoP